MWSIQKLTDIYKVQGLETERCNNLYGYIIERTFYSLNKKGLTGMIIPISAFSNSSMESLQKFFKNFQLSFVSNFHQRPAALFEGVLQRLSIFISYKENNQKSIFSTPVLRWKSETRSYLFPSISYIKTENQGQNNLFKIGSNIEIQLLQKYLKHKQISYLVSNIDLNKNKIFYRTAGGGYWVTFLNTCFDTTSLSNKHASFQTIYNAKILSAVLNSNLFWWYYTINFDQFNFKDYMILGFRFNYPNDNHSNTCT